VAKTNENGEIAFSKGDNDIFTRAWTITDAMQNLTTDERAVLEQFEQKWFDGYSLYAGSLVYENALPVFLRHEGLLRTVRASNPRGSSSEHGVRRGVRKSFGALRFFAMFTGSLRPAWEFDAKLSCIQIDPCSSWPQGRAELGLPFSTSRDRQER
jgi:hypothetical protein